MIKDNQKIFNRLLVFLDAVTTFITFVTAYWIRFKVFENEADVGVLTIKEYFRLLVFIVPAFLFLYYKCDVYSPKRTVRIFKETVAVAKANIIGLAATFIVLYAFIKQIDYSRSMLFMFVVINVTLTAIIRMILRRLLRSMRKHGYNIKHVLVAGYSRAGEEYITKMMENPQWGYSVFGILDDHVPVGTFFKGVKVIGTIAELEKLIEENDFDEIAISLSLSDYAKLSGLVSVCEKSGIHTKFVPDYNSLIPSRPYTEDLNGLPVINIRYVPLTNAANVFVKRVMDIVGSIFGIILTSPIMIFAAVCIKLTDTGPVFFKQERIGLHNKPFYMYKFRSMKIQTEEEEKKCWTTKDDPRITPIGRFLRQTSLDELPQLFNILKGDMSLVGPRPERPQFVEKFKEEIPRYMVKHQVRPGLTGWAQVNGYRGDTSIYKRIEYDLFYIENWSVGLDLKIIFMTFLTGFINKNAY